MALYFGDGNKTNIINVSVLSTQIAQLYKSALIFIYVILNRLWHCAENMKWDHTLGSGKRFAVAF